MYNSHSHPHLAHLSAPAVRWVSAVTVWDHSPIESIFSQLPGAGSPPSALKTFLPTASSPFLVQWKWTQLWVWNVSILIKSKWYCLTLLFVSNWTFFITSNIFEKLRILGYLWYYIYSSRKKIILSLCFCKTLASFNKTVWLFLPKSIPGRFHHFFSIVIYYYIGAEIMFGETDSGTKLSDLKSWLCCLLIIWVGKLTSLALTSFHLGG